MKDIENNCLNYMRIDGKRGESIPLFSWEMNIKFRLKNCCDYYGKEYGFHRDVQFDQDLYLRLIKNKNIYFRFEGIILKRKNDYRNRFKFICNF